MKSEPLKELRFEGLLIHGPIPVVKQDRYEKEYICQQNGLSYIYMYKKGNDNPIEKHYLGDSLTNEECTFAQIEEAYKEEIESYDFVEVEFSSALRGGKYEYSKEDGEWYLTSRNQGWA